MVMPLSFQVLEDIRLRESISKRGFARIMKAKLRSMLLFWHRLYSRRHFKRGAYSRYGKSAYPFQKRSPKRPLFISGTLEKRITKKKTLADTRGTSKTASLNMLLGRPAKYTDEFLRTAIFTVMEKLEIPFKEAERRIFSKAGFGPENRNEIQIKMRAMSPDERDKMAKKLERDIVREGNKSGQKRRRTIRG